MLRIIVQVITFICFAIIGIIGIKTRFKYDGSDQEMLLCIVSSIIAVVAIAVVAFDIV